MKMVRLNKSVVFSGFFVGFFFFPLLVNIVKVLNSKLVD